jgi:acetylornithine deacetylase/succinyl-diaminopimelate desuccinylase-like protein
MMKGGEVGGVIAANATAEIAMRLVKENSPRQMVDRVLAHIRKQGYSCSAAAPAGSSRCCSVALAIRGCAANVAVSGSLSTMAAHGC